MKLSYIRDAHLSQLKVNLAEISDYYSLEEPWLDSYFETNWFLSSNTIEYEEFSLIEPVTPAIHYDFENAKITFSALKHLSIIQATDERFWAYLSHVTFWSYMRKRWPVERYLGADNFARNIQERYLFMQNRDRALIRNGIARLWWYGYASYDNQRADPFELTKVLVSKLDIAESLLGRSFSRNNLFTRTILAVIVEMQRKGKPLPKRDEFRNLMMHINRMGGVTVLDALQPDDLEKIVVSKIAG